jgi:c(7)-type cytochrome triheme protein
MSANPRIASLLAAITLSTVACVNTVEDEGADLRLQPAAAQSLPGPASDRVVLVAASARDHLRGLPPDQHGNRVDWVRALRQNKINPRANVAGTMDQLVVDMDIVMPVNSSMPNVRFSHKSHTEWLICNNCHTALFQMERGASQISMEAIARGESCGVCHGTVAFPVNDCMRCHSVPK